MTDSSSAKSRFDPRFNAAFQPGYNPAEYAAPPPNDRVDRVEVAHRADDRPSVNTIEAATLDVGSLKVGSLDVGSLEVSALESDVRHSDEPLEAGLLASLRRFDPYLIALWLLSIVFMAAGVVMVRYIDDRVSRMNSGGGSSFSYYLLQVYTIGAPLLFALGLATATGTIFLLASRRRRTG